MVVLTISVGVIFRCHSFITESVKALIMLFGSAKPIMSPQHEAAFLFPSQILLLPTILLLLMRMQVSNAMKIQCPQCAYSADLDAFIPKRFNEWFVDRAFPLLLVVVLLGLLKAIGVLR